MTIDNMDNSNSKQNRLKVIYCGIDNGYFESFRKYLTEQDSKLFEIASVSIQKLSLLAFEKILRTLISDTKVVLVLDYYELQEKMEAVCGLLWSRHFYQKFHVVCLIKKEMQSRLRLEIEVGLYSAFVKDPYDLHNIYANIVLCSGLPYVKPKVARAIYSEELIAYLPCVVQYVDKDKAMIETPFDLEERGSIHLEWSIADELIPNKRYSVTKVESPKYYNLNAHTFEVLLNHTPILENKNLLEAQIRKLKTQRGVGEITSVSFIEMEKYLAKLKNPFAAFLSGGGGEKKNEKDVQSVTERLKKVLKDEQKCHFHNWIQRNKGAFELARVLEIFDPSLILNGEGGDEKNYSSLRVTFEDEYESIIRQWKPGIIVFQSHGNYAECIQIKKIIETVSSIIDYFPYVCLFDSRDVDSVRVRDIYMYHQMVCFESEYNYDLLKKIIELYLRKIDERESVKARKVGRAVKSITQEDVSDEYFKQLRFRPSYNDKMIAIKYPVKIEIISVSEYEFVFSCQQEIVPPAKIWLSLPLVVRVNVVEKKERISGSRVQGEIYRGLVELVTPEDKERLRRYVNSVYRGFSSGKDQLTGEQILQIRMDFLS